jgi:glycosyltransferase involved in cell wall biosynthesis
MGEEPTVSAIIPVYNGERFLAEAIASVLAQTHHAVETIVVDDGSTDGSAEVAKRFEPRVRYVHQGNGGPAAAMNRGVEAATGGMVAFLAADDRWSPSKLERQLERLEGAERTAACITWIENFWDAEMQVEEKRLQDHRIARPFAGYSADTLIVDRTLFLRVGAFDSRYAHGNELDWFLRAAEAGVEIRVVPEVLVHRRLHAANRSRGLASESRRSYLRVLKASLDRRRSGGAPLELYAFDPEGP